MSAIYVADTHRGRRIGSRLLDAVAVHILAADVHVECFDATHSMARPAMEDHEAFGLITAVLWPRR